jgi:hypothetical protein
MVDEESDGNSVTVFRFNTNNPKFRHVKLKCGHVQRFAETYVIEGDGYPEYCDECDEGVDVDVDSSIEHC